MSSDKRLDSPRGASLCIFALTGVRPHLFVTPIIASVIMVAQIITVIIMPVISSPPRRPEPQPLLDIPFPRPVKL